MKILVMGGSRFMGLATVRELLAHGHSVTVLNRGTRAVEWPGPVTELRGDRNDPQALRQLNGLAFDGVIDLSAYTGEQTRLLLAAPGMKDVPRWVHCSSGAVYAPQPILPWKENGAMGPWSLWGQYAIDKLDGERSLQTRRAANLIYNAGDATAAELREVLDDLKARVCDRFGLRLEEEVQFLGFEVPAVR